MVMTYTRKPKIINSIDAALIFIWCTLLNWYFVDFLLYKQKYLFILLECRLQGKILKLNLFNFPNLINYFIFQWLYTYTNRIRVVSCSVNEGRSLVGKIFIILFRIVPKKTIRWIWTHFCVVSRPIEMKWPQFPGMIFLLLSNNQFRKSTSIWLPSKSIFMTS